MALASTIAGAVAAQFPKAVSPRTHSILDYATAAVFMAAGAFFWRRNRRAAVASFVNGGAIAGVALLTDYSGDGSNAISYRVHGKIEAGFPVLTAGLPNLLGFAEEPEAQFFKAAAITQATIAGLTDYGSASASQIDAA